jgi:hypothetical protein
LLPDSQKRCTWLGTYRSNSETSSRDILGERASRIKWTVNPDRLLAIILFVNKIKPRKMPNEGSDNIKARAVLTHIDFNMSSEVSLLFMRRLLKTSLGVLKGSLMKYLQKFLYDIQFKY